MPVGGDRLGGLGKGMVYMATGDRSPVWLVYVHGKNNWPQMI